MHIGTENISGVIITVVHYTTHLSCTHRLTNWHHFPNWHLTSQCTVYIQLNLIQLCG